MFRWLCVRFAGQITSRSVKGADGLTAFQRAFSARVSPTSHACSIIRKDLVLGSEQEEGSDHRQVFQTGSSWASRNCRVLTRRWHVEVS